MGLEQLSTDQLEQLLAGDEELISAARARQLAVLEELDRRQVAIADGCKSLAEWLASRLDLSLGTARTLVRVMRRTMQRPDLREALIEAGVSLDRVEVLSRIGEDVGLLSHLDIAGVEAEAAMRLRLTAAQESRSAADQFLVMQPSLDESWYRGWFGLDGHSGAIVAKAIAERADRLPPLPDGSRGAQAWRNAVALTEICVSEDPAPAQVTVFVDARYAAETNGEAGVVLEAGPRVGAQALQAILCDAIVEVTARSEEGIPMCYGRSQRTAPPALRRALIAAQGGLCAADGCSSRSRLQIHHLNTWAQAGETNPEDLMVLCWFHHQVVVHQRGYHIYRDPKHGRIRFRPPNTPARPPPR